MWARGSAPAELRPPSYDHIPFYARSCIGYFVVVEWQTPIQKPTAYGTRSHSTTTHIHTLLFFSYFTFRRARRGVGGRRRSSAEPTTLAAERRVP